MFTHIVFFRLKDKSPESIKKTRDVLRGMEGRIPQLKAIEVGVDELHTERSYDISLLTKFESKSDMDAYHIHPVHQEVLAHMRTAVEASAAVDYEDVE